MPVDVAQLKRTARAWPGRAIILAVAVVLGGSAWIVASRGQSPHPQARLSFMDHACRLEREHLIRIWRGHDQNLSEELLFVPREPNYLGSFDLTSHSGPWDYLQEVPLVFYGPNRIAASGDPLSTPANIVDIYPTVAELSGVEIDRRQGRVLDEALAPGTDHPPRLFVVVVWDGVGQTTLERWPDRWPTLRRLGHEGTSYDSATVGSSPSITSSIHSSLGTGAYPRDHKVTGNEVRGANGHLRNTFSGTTARDLKLSTFADQIDFALANEPKVGLLGWRPWHLGMLGHGAETAGGDRDEVALIHYNDRLSISSNPTMYSAPIGLAESTDVHAHITKLDRKDGRGDGTWRGHDITPTETSVNWVTYSNPAWASAESEIAVEMLRRGGYGRDEVPDFFFVNFKMTDLVGHQWGVESAEMGDVVKAQDDALASILDYLDEEIGEYVVVVTADHGHSETAASSGAWPISKEELVRDINDHFHAPDDQSLVEASVAYGFFLNRGLMEHLGVSANEIAQFVDDQTIEENWADPALPKGYERRADERVFDAAFPSDRLMEIMKCRFGNKTWRNQRALPVPSSVPDSGQTWGTASAAGPGRTCTPAQTSHLPSRKCSREHLLFATTSETLGQLTTGGNVVADREAGDE